MPDNMFFGTIEVTTEEAVKGTMLLLLDNTDEYDPISESSSPPAAFRVVVVNFPTLSTTGTSEVLSFGDEERLQFQSNYSLVAASISTTQLDVTDSPSLTIDPPRIREFKLEQGPNIGEMLVSLEGSQTGTDSLFALLFL
ncbi:hypothetical protein BLNAU_11858 [Blattamonas nauphoetae]|uniref:Uncharacterized protein n=1 Tax=Blattamonas nauphoetae TaxID=2049346 RepID=A0ABQ9XR83_9EUKA|nr:hypothetical protein BLNAU_11858 [Blattamonas nauphoetae]